MGKAMKQRYYHLPATGKSTVVNNAFLPAKRAHSDRCPGPNQQSAIGN
jgi:hypothetical protein